jgi:hypothetical protein
MSKNSTSTVNSILARCFVEPSFLDQMVSNVQSALRGYALDEQALSDFQKLDIGRVRNIAGFITKVKNGHFRSVLPSTTALLEYYAKEIEVFAEFNAIQQGWGSTAEVSKQARLSRFIRFVADRIETGLFEGLVGLREIFMHERLQWQATAGFAEDVAAVPNRPMPGSFLPASREDLDVLSPVVQGRLLVGRYDLDPLVIDSLIIQGRFSPEAITGGSRFVAYWGDPASRRVRCLDLDAATAVLLDYVDGERSVASISLEARNVLGPDLVEAEVKDFFWHAASMGMFRFEAPVSQ